MIMSNHLHAKMLLIDDWYDGMLSGFMLHESKVYYIMLVSDPFSDDVWKYKALQVPDADVILLLGQGDLIGNPKDNKPLPGEQWRTYIDEMVEGRNPDFFIYEDGTIENTI